jgi:GR25 family glycosyltransferase involved in LPS biosynthesis
MKLNDYFDRVVVINLDRRTDRMAQFESQTKDLGIDFVRYSAVDAQAFGIDGVTACRQSHHKVLVDAVADGVERLFVFEDDAEFRPGFNESFAGVTANLPNDWQMLYLGSWPYSSIDVGIDNLRLTHGNITTHAYGAKREIFKDLITAAENQEHPIDVAYGLLHPTIKTYMAHPSIVTQAIGISDIRKGLVNYQDFII